MCKETYEIFKINSRTLMFEDDSKETADNMLKEVSKFIENTVDHI